MGSNITNNQLIFTPENTIHAFTTSFEIKTTHTGDIIAFSSNFGVGNISIDTSGYLKYTSPLGNSITSNAAVNNNSWNKIALTHYYALGKTVLYLNKTEIGRLDEQLIGNTFYLNPINSPEIIDYKNWFFYRSAMTSEEINVLHDDDTMLKSSLELYAPLDGEAILGNDPLINLAQSLNSICSEETAMTLALEKENSVSKMFSNPVYDYLDLSKFSGYKEINIFNSLGANALSLNIKNNKKIHIKHLKNGIYIAILKNDSG